VLERRGNERRVLFVAVVKGAPAGAAGAAAAEAASKGAGRKRRGASGARAL
jgi:hypothetical protein